MPGFRKAPRAIGLAALVSGLDTLLVVLPRLNWDLFRLGLPYNWLGKVFSVLLSAVVLYGLR